jgi:3-hydroxyisobutyryl-CoA hydrolase
MLTGITHQIVEWNLRGRLEGIVIDREAVRDPRPVFCPGRDIKALYQYAIHKSDDAEKTAEVDYEQKAEDFFKQQYALNSLIANSKIPVIVINDGFTRGSGLALTANAPYRIATENTVIDLPQNQVGLFTDIGSSRLFERFNNLSLGLFLSLTGSKVNANDCMMHRFHTHFLKSAEIPLFLKGLSTNSKPLSLHFDEMHFDLNLRAADKVPKLDMKKIQTYFKPDNNGVSGIMARLAASQNPWCHEMLALMRKSSPASLELSYYLITHGSRVPTFESVEADIKAAKLIFSKKHSPLKPHFVRGAERLLKLSQQSGWPSDSVTADLEQLHSATHRPKV